MALVLEQPANYALARQYSEVSLKINSHQQRALYNLSVSEHHDGKFALAEELLTRAVREENWQEKKYAGRLHNLYYNRACARGRLAQDPASDPQKRDPGKLLGEAMEDFKEALGIARLGSWDLDDWNSLVGDCYPAGDLGLLTQKHPDAVFKLLGHNFPAVPVQTRDEAVRLLRGKS